MWAKQRFLTVKWINKQEPLVSELLELDNTAMVPSSGNKRGCNSIEETGAGAVHHRMQAHTSKADLEYKFFILISDASIWNMLEDKYLQ